MKSDIDTSVSHATLNKLRAAVLGANDGIVSTSSVVMGVAGAGASRGAIFTAGMAALVAGALSMAVGEYVSVSSQSDAEKVRLKKAKEHDKNAEHEITNPWAAAIASLVAFTVGGVIPFVAIIASPTGSGILITVIAVLAALLVTGYASATVGGASRRRAMLRVVSGGLLAMGITYLVGMAFGASIS